MPRLRRDVASAAIARILGVVAAAVYVACSGADSDRSPGPTTAAPVRSSPTPSPPAALLDPAVVGAVTTRGPTAVRAGPAPTAPVLSRLRANVTLPVLSRRGVAFAVLTPCEAEGWVAAADVLAHPRAVGSPTTLAEATIVIDPGHGGQLPGATGPGGLTEKAANYEIATRLAELLGRARVFLTRTGDYTAGIAYRAAIANRLNAHVLVSVHNNADPDGPAQRPGTETYFQARSGASKRLAGLLYEDIHAALRRFDVAWVADVDAGAKFRTNDRGDDYYALLRRANVPAVLVEAMFISNAPEEELLRQPSVLDLLAQAARRGIGRYIGSDDPGSGFVARPLPRPPGPSGRLPAACIEPGP